MWSPHRRRWILPPSMFLEEHRLNNIRKFDENLIRVEYIGVPKLHCLAESCAFHPFSVRDGRVWFNSTAIWARMSSMTANMDTYVCLFRHCRLTANCNLLQEWLISWETFWLVCRCGKVMPVVAVYWQAIPACPWSNNWGGVWGSNGHNR